MLFSVLLKKQHTSGYSCPLSLFPGSTQIMRLHHIISLCCRDSNLILFIIQYCSRTAVPYPAFHRHINIGGQFFPGHNNRDHHTQGRLHRYKGYWEVLIWLFAISGLIICPASMEYDIKRDRLKQQTRFHTAEKPVFCYNPL